MADDTELNPGAGGDVIDTVEQPSGTKIQRMVPSVLDAAGVAKSVSRDDPIPVDIAPNFSQNTIYSAGGRMKTVLPVPFFHAKNLGSINPGFVQDVTGAATILHNAIDQAADFAVTGFGDIGILQSAVRVPNQSGRTHTWDAQILFGPPEPDVDKRAGFFDGANGALFEVDPTGIFVVLRRNGIDTRIPQSAWNIDKLDGTGGTGITLDLTKIQHLQIGFLWPSSGVVWSFLIGGAPVLVHFEPDANVESVPSFNIPSQPHRFELRSAGSPGTMKMWSTSTTQEGNLQPLGVKRASLAPDFIDVEQAPVWKVLRTIQLAVPTGAIIQIAAEVIAETAAAGEFALMVGGTLDAVQVFTPVPESFMEEADGGQTVTAEGIIQLHGYLTTSTRKSGDDAFVGLLGGAQVDGTPIPVHLVGRHFASGTKKYRGTLSWEEGA